MTFLPLQARLTDITFSDGLIIALMGFGIVIAVLLILALFVKLLSALISGVQKTGKGKVKESDALTEVNTPAPVLSHPAKAPSAAVTPGYLRLDGTGEKEAAVIMAIISDKTGISLSHLCFSEIKRLGQDPELIGISEQDAAAVMAITADKTGVAPDKLLFHSIKLLED